MTEDQKIILSFCIGKWEHLVPLEREIPRSTLYRVAKDLCGKRLLLHRRKKGYKTTQRGTQLVREEKTPLGTLLEVNSSEKGQPPEEKRQTTPKKPPVNLARIQSLLKLPDEVIDFFPFLYPPLKKVPTLTYRAMIELFWAEVCDRTCPVSEDHHLNFLNIGDTLTWKTSSARFCAHMVSGEETAPYILELSREGGCSLWLRKTPTGKIIFKREILEKPYICLDDYHRAGREGKEAAAHLLTGRTQIPVENKIQIIRCVTLVNLNPQKGTSIFEQTGFDAPLIRRFVPYHLDAIELPDLKKIGQEALDAAKEFGPLKIETPTSSSCREYRNELIDYSEKLFTEEAQRYIDIEGLLNIARGFTGYGLTPSDAVRYILHKISLLYRTVGWVRPQWIEGFDKEKSRVRIQEPVTSKMEARKESFQAFGKSVRKKTVDKKDLQTLKETIKFRQEYEDELGKLEKWATEIEEVKKFLEQEGSDWERVNQFLSEEGDGIPSLKRCENALQEVSKEYRNIQEGGWVSLENLKKTNNWLNETYIRPLIDGKERAQAYKEIWDGIWDEISNAKKISELPPIREAIDESSLPPSLKCRLKETIGEKRTVLEQEKQAKIKELANYLRKIKELDIWDGEERKKLARDITENLLQIEVVKKEDDHLKGKDRQSYPLDTFDFPKWASPGNFLDWNFACCRALTLLTGTKHQSLRETDFSFSVSQKRGKNEGMPTWGKWALGLGIVATGVWTLCSLLESKKFGHYIQAEKGLIQIRFLRKEDGWLLFQSKDGYIWKLLHNTTRIAVLLKPEYGGYAYWFIRQEGENLVARANEKDKEIPINQVDKIVYTGQVLQVPFSQKEAQPEIPKNNQVSNKCICP